MEWLFDTQMVVGVLKKVWNARNSKYISIFSDPCRILHNIKNLNLISNVVLCCLGFTTELLIHPHRILNENLTILGVPALPVLCQSFSNMCHEVFHLLPSFVSDPPQF